MAIELLLLDAGNTVIYLDHAAVGTEVGLDAAVLRAAEDVAKARYQSMLKAGGSHDDGWFRFMAWLLEEAGFEGDVEDAVRRLRAVHDDFNLWRRVPEGLVAAIEEVRAAGIRVGIVSNSEGKLDDVFSRVGVAHLFEHVVDSAFEGVCKPDPEIFRRALARFGVAAEKTLYAGDIPGVDVEGARRAGVHGALVDTAGAFRDYVEAPRFEETTEMIAAMRSGTIPEPLVKIVPRAEWEAREATVPWAPVDREDGFVHLSARHQVAATRQKHFAGQDVVEVALDPTRLPGLRWEPSRGGKLFPHVYGDVSLDAVSAWE